LTVVKRSQRVSHENLRLRDKEYLECYEAWFAQQDNPVPPMFTPFRLRDVVVPNRVVVSPKAMYSAVEGTVNDFHNIN
jgi:anthraniloyl-CoA monooxygenase